MRRARFETRGDFAWNSRIARPTNLFRAAFTAAGLLAASNAWAVAITNANLYVAGGATKDIAAGDEEVITSNFRVGNGGAGVGTLNLNGGLTVGNINAYVGYTSGVTGLLTMAEGSYLYCTNGTSSYVMVGGRSTSYQGHGILNQTGGLLRARSLNVGNFGSAEVTLAGGDIVVDQYLVFSPGISGATLRMLGGTLTVTNNNVELGYNLPVTPMLVVSGGVFRALKINMGRYAGSSGGDWVIAGGSNYVAGLVNVGEAAGSTGTILMSGGYFECGDLVVGDGADVHGRMTVSGGKVVLTSALAVANTGGDGVVVIEGEGEVDLVHAGSDKYKIGAAQGSVTNRNGGTLRWQHAIGRNGGAANIVNTNATLALRDMAAANIADTADSASFGRIVKQAGSRLALENSTNALIAGTFELKEASGSYRSLILREGAPCWQSGTLAVRSTGELVVSNAAAAVVSAQVSSSGRILVSGAACTFAGDVSVLPEGSVCGDAGAVLKFGGDFLNGCTNRTGFDLSGSEVVFTGGGDHTNAVMGTRNGGFLPEDYAYGTLRVEAGNDVYFTDGDGAGNKALYVGHVDLAGCSVAAVTQLHSAFDIYYLPSSEEPRNAYLDNQSYPLEGGGRLRAFPRPGSVLFLK